MIWYIVPKLASVSLEGNFLEFFGGLKEIVHFSSTHYLVERIL